MATGTRSDFASGIFEEAFFSALVESLTQSMAPMMSVGIRTSTQYHPADYLRRSIVKALTAIARRDDTAVTGVTDTAVTLDQDVAVKLFRRIGPIATTLTQWRQAGIDFVSTEDPSGMGGFGSYLGASIATETALDMLNSALLALRVFLETANTNSQRHTIAANGTMTTAAMVSGLALMGDAAERVQGWVMHSKPAFDLLQHQLNPSNAGSDAAFAVLQNAGPVALNRPLYISDSASLVVTGTPNLYRTLGLTADAAELIASEEQTVTTQAITGLENLVMRMQGEFGYSLRVKGARWDVTNGGRNPNATAVGTGTNWDQVATSMKDGPGVVIISG